MKTKILTITILTTAWIAQAGAVTPSDLIRTMHERGNISVTHTQSTSHPQHRAVQERPAHHTRHRTHHTERTTHRTQSRRVHHPKRQTTRHAATEKKLAGQTPVRRRFRTLAEYQRLERRAERRTERRANRHTSRKQVVRHARHVAPSHGRLTPQKRYVGNGWYVDEHGQYDEQYTDSCTTPVVKPRRRHRPQKAFRYYRRQWYLTYLWEHASFVDQYGYFYGTFDARGFYFEGKYYRYDRAYTYQDRLHGKGLFEHRFYRPRHHRVRRHRADTGTVDGEVYVEWTWRR